MAALPESGGILFGIEIVLIPLAGIKADPHACRGMIRALQTMPDAMAVYKGIAPARTRLLGFWSRFETHQAPIQCRQWRWVRDLYQRSSVG